jgi:transcriptional regulator with XRE-family HTH domain
MLRTDANDSGLRFAQPAAMPNVTRIHNSKQPRRPHYIEEWAERREMKQADIARELGADKSIVSRWFGGATPSQEWQEKLAALFRCDPESLFRHPDDDWLSKFFADRSRDEIERIKATLEAAFPRKTGTGG